MNLETRLVFWNWINAQGYDKTFQCKTGQVRAGQENRITKTQVWYTWIFLVCLGNFNIIFVSLFHIFLDICWHLGNISRFSWTGLINNSFFLFCRAGCGKCKAGQGGSLFWCALKH